MPGEEFSSLSQLFPALTNQRLSDALSDWFADSMTFSHWQYVSESGKGDSYLSEVIRIRVCGTNENGVLKSVQIFLKSIPRSVSRRLTFRSDEFFKNEISFYDNVLPALLKFQASKNVKEPFDNYTKTFLTHCDGENDIIGVEDATLQDYTSATRQQTIDLAHCKVMFKTIAKFHALSFAMRDQQPKEFERIKNTLTEIYYHERLWDWYKRFWHRLCRIAIDAVEKEYPNSVYLKKVKEFAVPERYKDLIRAARSVENGVILHGDAWTNNVLFKYNDYGPVDGKLIDFQLAKYSSPVLDLTLIIYACTSQELRLKHYDELLQYYYNVLSTQIRDYGSDPNKVYSWETFMEEIKKYSYFGLAFSFESTPLIVLAPEDAIDMEMKGDQKVNIDDIWQVTPFKTKEARLREADNVVHCVDMGYI